MHIAPSSLYQNEIKNIYTWYIQHKESASLCSEEKN
jgi:hypothetical protein